MYRFLFYKVYTIHTNVSVSIIVPIGLEKTILSKIGQVNQSDNNVDGYFIIFRQLLFAIIQKNIGNFIKLPLKVLTRQHFLLETSNDYDDDLRNSFGLNLVYSGKNQQNGNLQYTFFSSYKI